MPVEIEKASQHMSNTEPKQQPSDEVAFPVGWHVSENNHGHYANRVSGQLPGGKWLTHPIDVVIEEDDGEFLVSEARFFMHASGATKAEAMEEFKRVLSEELDMLTADEKVLGPRLQAQLHYLRTIIRTA